MCPYFMSVLGAVPLYILRNKTVQAHTSLKSLYSSVGVNTSYRPTTYREREGDDKS